MTETRLWDRAALTVQTGERRLPAVASLPSALPTVAELFDFMRDAELRFATLRMRILEETGTTQGPGLRCSSTCSSATSATRG